MKLIELPKDLKIANGQEADSLAIKMVKEIYEPIVKAIDNRYSVVVEFK